MKLKLKLVGPNIYCIVASNYRLLAQTFVRIQEFYESPFKQIRGKHFTLSFFKKLYSKDRGYFSYYEDWAGFNVPGHVVIDFFNTFVDLSPKEKCLKKLLQKALMSNEKFYVIGIPKRSHQDVFSHELAHAFYYTSIKFKRMMMHVTRKLSLKIKRQIFAKLKEIGYNGSVRFDELQAYMATTKIKHLIDYFGYGIRLSHVEPFRKVFSKFKYDNLPTLQLT